MITGIGTDVVRIKRMAAALERRGDVFARRILTANELKAFHCVARKAAFLSKRFAAKEAAAKAFGTGIGQLSFQDIEVSHNEAGRPELVLSGYARELCERNHITSTWVSISDETDIAAAFVILERDSSFTSD
ncbi:Holo-[acyl-carrier-protein] synthase [invertebrate metagenome]|uniref:Holo-[acyl-carrier-protein] synthase n=1 Tax=invertebrate metagenome TaxID=1711999 RepID=A0A2H9T8L0_9ZZZZ